jgi:AcrR family transcriptional regulator
MGAASITRRIRHIPRYKLETASCARRLILVRQGRLSPEEVPALDERIKNAHALQNEALTRLRLLTTEKAVAAAENLHGIDHKLVDCARDPASPLDSRWQASLDISTTAREQLIDAARTSMGLSIGAPIGAAMLESRVDTGGRG